MNEHKKKVKRNKFGKFLLCLLTILIFFGVGAGTYFYWSSKILTDENIESIKPSGKEPVNILVLGVDGITDNIDKNEPKRTDSMMLMNYNPVNKNINIISIPRDTLISINGNKHKINEAHAFGGVGYSIDAVEKLLDLNINYYAKVDYAGFRQIIDSIGGIDMQIENNMDYDDEGQDLHIHFKKGDVVHLDGQKAEEFFRWRKNNDGSGLPEGDLGRIKNQHIFVEKVIEKFKSPAAIIKIPSLVSTAKRHTETNMSINEMFKYGILFAKNNKNNIKMTTLKGTPEYINNVSYFIYDERLNKELLASLYGFGADNRANIDKSNIKIQVLNGTDKNGLASGVKDDLQKKGYTNIVIDNNSSKVDKTEISVYNLDKSVLPEIKSEFDIKNIKLVSNEKSNFDIIVILGEDYVLSN